MEATDPAPPPPADWMPLIDRALAEDRAADDVTTRALLPKARAATAAMTVKAAGVVCGLALAEPIFQRIDEALDVELSAQDGDSVGAGTRLLTVRGDARSILRVERTVLNVVQRLSGVATRTAAFVERVMGAGAGIYDTRKTTPGWRTLEKYAVRCGGGRNHRMDLADAIMIKENHLLACHGRTGPEAIAEALERCKSVLTRDLPVYVEVESQAELEAAVEAGAGIDGLVVMLDDFDIAAIRRAIAYVRRRPPPRPQLEVTGGVTLERVEGLAATGVRRISTGSLTHSAPALDVSLAIVRGT
jgi:nicotinate-nucleotide pyrophosphorylase (carboxylating)